MTNGYETMLVTAYYVRMCRVLLRRRFILISALCPAALGLLAACSRHQSHGSADHATHPCTFLAASLSACLCHHDGLCSSHSPFQRSDSSVFQPERETAEEQMQIMQIYSKLLLYPAVVLLSIRNFVGAIWANVS